MITIGTKVRMSTKWLRSTGSYTGSAPLDRWVVVACDCSQCVRGVWVAVNERNLDNDGQRHIAVANLQKVGK